MEKDQTIPVTIWLAGRDYQIRINPEDEEAVRAATKAAADQLQELREHYEGKDDQDFLAMCLIMYASNQAVQDKESSPVLLTALKEMKTSIDKALAE